MAKDTPLTLRNLFIYQVYVRNHSETGDFQGVINDLDRIKDLGVDVLYLIPIHPVGQVNKKGSLGSIYSISDYRSINPEYGTMDDFKRLIEATHQRGMKLMIDIVFNHTSHESLLFKQHPEWFYLKDGKPGNRVGDWYDIIDLDFSNQDLWEYLFETLEMYAEMGVDGYRCDVAPLIPLDFWIEARKRIQRINPDFIWLSESVHKSFIKHLRDRGFEAHSDGEMYQAFDILYDYDIFDYLHGYLKGENTLKTYLEEILNQEMIYPSNYVKLRNLENHDQPRIASFVDSRRVLNHLHGFLFFQKGATMVYAGQECYNTNRPSLFDRDPVDWSTYETDHCVDLIRTLAEIKKDPIMASGNFNILESNHEDVAIMTYENEEKIRYGIFNFKEEDVIVHIDLPNGEYINLIDQSIVEMINGLMIKEQPIIIDIEKSN